MVVSGCLRHHGDGCGGGEWLYQAVCVTMVMVVEVHGEWMYQAVCVILHPKCGKKVITHYN